jgi:hypothetical protein
MSNLLQALRAVLSGGNNQEPVGPMDGAGAERRQRATSLQSGAARAVEIARVSIDNREESDVAEVEIALADLEGTLWPTGRHRDGHTRWASNRPPGAGRRARAP